MIILTQGYSSPMTLQFLATKGTATANKKLIQSSIGCSNYTECFEGRLPAFANLSDLTDSKTNDFNSFLLEYNSFNDINAVLINKDTGIEYPIIDNTYGKLFTPAQIGSLKFGFLLRWREVANLIGFGNYDFKIEVSNSITTDIVFTELHKFRLMPFTCENADNTVRITLEKLGYIENGNDYRGFSTGSWTDQIRFYGKLSNAGHNTETDNLLLSNRQLHQIQTQIIDKFSLRIDSVISSDAMRFLKDDLLSNVLTVDDYNRSNITNYKSLKVSLVDIEDPIQHEINGTYTYTINLVEFNQSTLKRNF